jgi:predicted transcriptional regulator
MAKDAGILIQNVMELLEKEPDGLEFAEIVEQLSRVQDVGSERGVRNLLNRLAKEGKLIRRKGWSTKPGAQPYIYCHPKTQPRQLEIPGIKEYRIHTKTEFEIGELNQEERQQQQKAVSVLESIASGHLHQESYARAIIEAAPKLAAENPVELVVGMARWVVDDLNILAAEIERKLKRGAVDESKKMAVKLDSQLGWAKRYFQEFWKLYDRVEELPGILELPSQAKRFRLYGETAKLDEKKAREQLKKRIFGARLIQEQLLPTDLHKSAAGTDASVADLFLEHTAGSFIPPDPVIVPCSAAALVTNSKNGFSDEYQDFDIFPDKLREYDDHTAAVNGLVLSATLARNFVEESNLQHTRKAAMDLRQYLQDFRIATKQADWRPMGDSPELGTKNRPKLIIRDGRIFPLVHRLRDYETGGLYGQIVRSEIEIFQQVFHNTLLGSGLDTVYGAAVKNPGMSWLAPLVFWYLYSNKSCVDGRVAVSTAEEVYQYPFADTAVSHLLFLGVAKNASNFSPERLFITCRVLRRFSDIALEAEEMSPIISQGDEITRVRENNLKDWKEFIEQHIAKKKKHYQSNNLDIDDYESFIYLCSKVGVSMCYAAPTSAYEFLSRNSSVSAHFLLPRLEVAINMERLESDREHEQECLDGLLSWLAAGHIELDRSHTQSGFDTGNPEHSLPILVPDVIVRAHEAATFTRDKLGEEVQDKIRALIAELRKRVEKGR